MNRMGRTRSGVSKLPRNTPPSPIQSGVTAYSRLVQSSVHPRSIKTALQRQETTFLRNDRRLGRLFAILGCFAKSQGWTPPSFSLPLVLSRPSGLAVDLPSLTSNPVSCHYV